MRDDFIVDLWARIKPLIMPKDRLDAADALISVCDEYGYADGIDQHEDLDRELKVAVKTYFGEDEEEEDEDDGYGSGW
jgi:hypothetical protein